MKERTKKALRRIVVLMMALVVLTVSGCGKYSSHWNATMMIQTSDKTKSSMKFSTFEGTMVYKLRCDDPSKKLVATATLGTGNMTVYYDCDDSKEEFFKLKDGDTLELEQDGLSEGIVYIIIESDGKCVNGNLTFRIE